METHEISKKELIQVIKEWLPTTDKYASRVYETNDTLTEKFGADPRLIFGHGYSYLQLIPSERESLQWHIDGLRDAMASFSEPKKLHNITKAKLLEEIKEWLVTIDKYTGRMGETVESLTEKVGADAISPLTEQVNELLAHVESLIKVMASLGADCVFRTAFWS